jgi:hypothetical protein
VSVPASNRPRRNRWRDTPARVVVFYALVASGCIAALSLGFNAIVNQPPLILAPPAASRSGLVDTVTVDVQNQSTTSAYCATVRISALDQNGDEIESEPARPQGGSSRIGPSGSVAFRARFTHLTSTDYLHTLDKFEAFLIRFVQC